MIAREYYDIWAFRPFCRLIGCIPVNRNGKDTGATRSALRALDEDRILPIFPEGKILMTSGEEIGEGEPGVGFLAIRANVPVVPAYIRGPLGRTGSWSRSSPPQRPGRLRPADRPVESRKRGEGGERAVRAAVTHHLMEAIRAFRDRVDREESGTDR